MVLHTVLVEGLEDVVRLLGRVDFNSLGCVSVLVTYGDLRKRQCIHNAKIKSETFIFCFGARGKSGLHARLLRGIRPEGVEIVRKTGRFSLATCPFFPVDLLKNECGAWLKIRWVEGFLFASLSLSASGSPKEKEVRPKCRGGRGCHGRVKIEVRADRYPSRTCGDET